MLLADCEAFALLGIKLIRSVTFPWNICDISAMKMQNINSALKDFFLYFTFKRKQNMSNTI